MSQEFDKLLEDREARLQEIARAAAARILEAMPEAVEVIWPKQTIASYGVGPKKMSEHFCYVALQKKHVNLGFYYGADLDDPAGLLEGSGKSLRHIKLRDAAQLEGAALKTLVFSASKHLPKLKGKKA